MGMEVSLQKQPKITGAHKIGTAISGPTIEGGKIMDVGLFLSGSVARSTTVSEIENHFCNAYLSEGKLQESFLYHCGPNYYKRTLTITKNSFQNTVRVNIITGSLVILGIFPQNYRYRYRLQIRMNSFNYHYGYRLGVRSHTFISIDSQLPSWKLFELISPKLPLPLPSSNVFESER